MLHVGPRTIDAAFNLASGANSLKPISSMSSVSNVAPSAVADWNDESQGNATIMRLILTGRHFAGVDMKK